MAPERAAAYLGGVILLAAWIASAAGVAQQPRVIRVPRTTPETVQLDALALEVQSQAARLRQRLASAPAPQAPLRNPFVFGSRDTPVRAPAARQAATLAPDAVAAPERVDPDLVLLGIAEQGDTRTAMIGAGDDLFTVTVGQPVGERYQVSAVGPDVVELKDRATGATRHLALKLPVSPR